MGVKISQLQKTIAYDGTELIAIVQKNTTRQGSLNSLIPFLSVNSSLNDVNGLKALSGNWQKAYTISTAYQTSSATFAPNSLVQSTSSLLLTRSDYSASSATITIVRSSSANWNSTYAIISTLSSSHGPTGLSGSVVYSTSNTLTADSGLIYTGTGSNGVLRVGGSLNLGTSGLNTSIIQTATGSSKTITLPNATGTVPVYTGTPLSGQVLTSSGTTGAATWVTATSANTANTLVKRDANGGTSFFGDVTINGAVGSTPRLILGNVQTTDETLECAGQIVFRRSDINRIGARVYGGEGTLSFDSADNGINYTGTTIIGTPALTGASASLSFYNVTGDKYYNFPNVSGTVALTDVAQTFTGQLESTNSVIKLTSLPVHNSEAAALTASPALSAGQIYRTSTGELRIKL